MPVCVIDKGVSAVPLNESEIALVFTRLVLPSSKSTLMGAPGQVHVWQYVDDATILDVAAAPSYQESQPNGPECAPVCRQASLSWTLD